MNGESTCYICGRSLQEDFASFCGDAARTFDAFDFLKGPATEMRELRKSAVHPFNIAVFGRMKTGKSTLINALIGRSLAITGVEEATATINVISYSDSPGVFRAHWKDSPPETFPISSLKDDWNGKTPEVLDRVRRVSCLELFSDAESLKLCEITDTPGTGSEASVHEDVTQNFLAATEKQGRRADAIIYVFPPVGRETDMGNLDTYRKNNCIPGSDPYNSVAVLHKWDHIFWENGGDMSDIRAKAARLKDVMSSMIADVIPVSAPLALAAVEAPDEFWACALEFCRTTKWEELERLLNRDGKWDRDEARRRFRIMYPLPWPSFQIIMREISTHLEDCLDVPAVRSRVMTLSGIQNLRTFLDRNFFKRGELIRQKQKYNEILRIKGTAYSLIERRLRKLNDDCKAWDVLFRDEHYENNPKMAAWISRNRSDCMLETGELTRSYDELDRRFLNSEIEERVVDADNLAWAENMQAQGKYFTDADVRTIKRLLLRLSGVEHQDVSAGEQNEAIALVEKLAGLSNHVKAEVRDNASRLMQRMSLIVE